MSTKGGAIKMKILHTADWHIGNFPGPEKDGMNLRCLDTVKCLHEIYRVAKEEKPEIILVSGDIFHQARVWADRGLIEVKTAIQMIELLTTISTVIVLRGTPNHDGAEQFEMLKTHFESNEQVKIVDTPQVLNIKDVQICCLPGFDKGIYRAKLSGLSKEEENLVFTSELSNVVFGLKAQCNTDKTSVLMAHYTVLGSNTESGQVQFFAQYEPIIPPETLDVAGFDLVALGHIHRPQQVMSCKNTFYSGAINANNFNDEGQERGFYIHTLDSNELKESKFYKTPSREFKTIKFDNDDVQIFNLSQECSIDDIKDKIVRIQYSCTDDNAKVLNKKALEDCLYKQGVFWVSDISPEKIDVTVNRKEIDKTDPLACLNTYLTDKLYTEEQIRQAMELGSPIIDEVMASAKTSALIGLFEPIEISVKNYRIYEEESFNFNDITFCTINGKNGAGKSSLFMDAILDCLYEEPREGDLTGWIRADEKARSGSISFTFRIGKNTYRVTRTRAKSGKATLNLAELTDGEWVNRSHEKMRDTQDDIINILGMDSLTFRSCALIMQDQYGLFLEADKESRIKILGNILGLGMYEEMQELTKDKLSEINREISTAKAQILNLEEKTVNSDEIEASIIKNREEISKNQDEYKSLNQEKESANHSLIKLETAKKKYLELKAEIDNLYNKKSIAQAQISTQESIIANANNVINQEKNINEGVARYKELLEEEKKLIAGYKVYEAKELERLSLAKKIDKLIVKLEDYGTKETEYENKLKNIEGKLSREDELRKAFTEYMELEDALIQTNVVTQRYINLKNKETSSGIDLMNAKQVYDRAKSEKLMQMDFLKSKMALIDNCNCLDIEKANCKFLQDAIKARNEFGTLEKDFIEWEKSELTKVKDLERIHLKAETEVTKLNFDSEKESQIRDKMSGLEMKVNEYNDLKFLKEQHKSLKEIYETITEEKTKVWEEMVALQKQKAVLSKEVDKLREENNGYIRVKMDIANNAYWLDREKQLPVAKERKANAVIRIEEIKRDIAEAENLINEKYKEYQNETIEAQWIEKIKEKIRELETTLTEKHKRIEDLQAECGALNNQYEQIQSIKNEIQVITQNIQILSSKACAFEILKIAFGVDGVSHNIIRNILSTITATANNILGQMTGGRMGMDFRTEKILKSNKKEVVTLDIYIEENGKPPLPYSSKSGGEKVKSALSAILALAETKSKSAGIRLGMLFIDEPPFLDSDGIQAYCDALETIRNRYKDIKIMAITHDEAMKARFPQSIDVIKTDSGSKVVLN